MKKISFVLVLVLAVLVLGGCKAKKNASPIVGSWTTKFASSEYTYTFNEDKTCSYDAAGTLMECTYEIEGDQLSILYKGNTAPFKTTYKIENNVLTIKDSFDKDVNYNKK